MIVGISGKKQSGKNTVAKIWQLLDVWYNTEERTNFDGMMSDTQYVEYMLEDDKISYNKSSWQQKSFAHKIKQITCILLGCTMEQLEDPIFKETPLGEEWWVIKLPSNWIIPYLGDYPSFYYKKYNVIKLTPRMLMQMLGTEFGREIIHPNIWVNATFADYQPNGAPYNSLGDVFDDLKLCPSETKMPNWIITDVRFPNEAEAIKDRGGILIRVNRDRIKIRDNMYIHREEYNKLHNIIEHESETALDNYENWDYVINNNDSIEGLIEQVKQIMIKEKIITHE